MKEFGKRMIVRFMLVLLIPILVLGLMVYPKKGGVRHAWRSWIDAFVMGDM